MTRRQRRASRSQGLTERIKRTGTRRYEAERGRRQALRDLLDVTECPACRAELRARFAEGAAS